MTYGERLRQLADLSVPEQQARREDSIDMFRMFWATHPTEEQFATATGGLVVFPEMIYLLAWRPWKEVPE